MATAVQAGQSQSLTGGAEYFGFNVVINNAKSVGAGACGGCSTPVCLLLFSLKMVTTSAPNDRTLTGPANLTDSDFATWQGGGGVVVGGGIGCPGALPTAHTTWGTVKALYR